MASLQTAKPGKPEARAFVGIECDVPSHLLTTTIDSYRGAYVKYGVPGQVHMYRLVATGNPVRDFGVAYSMACSLAANVYVSGTAHFFADRSGGVFSIVGGNIVRKRDLHAA
jgi:hypothetical protein